jgi:predicted glycoside hydrolase/deacetylase ChbG (UPF0249 family)
MPNKSTNELLDYPADARLLIINADDFGMYPEINDAVIRAFTEGVVRSTTLMTPCPGAKQAIQLLTEHRDIPFGVHLSVICDIDTYRWGPISLRENVSSLIEQDGNFYSLGRMSKFLAQAKTDELELEFRAQIETVLSAGLRPTHLDWHCLHAGGRADIFDMTLGLAKEYEFAIRVADQALSERLAQQGLPAAEHTLLDSFAIDTSDKLARYMQLLRDLPPGLSEWAVHPGLGTPEAQATDPDGWPVRHADYEFLMSQEAKDIIKDEGIILLDYRPLQDIWSAA